MRQEKIGIVADIGDKLKDSAYFISVNYTGMTVVNFSLARKKLRELGAELKVTKNTLLHKAAQQLGMPDFGVLLKGQCAAVTGQGDVCAVAKALQSITKELKKPDIIFGVLDNRLLTKDEVISLASMPPRDVLRAQLLGLLNTPGTSLVRVLNEPGASLARVLQAKVDAAASSAPAEATEVPVAA